MHIHYHCDWCGKAVAQLEMEVVDEAKLGLDCLTREERNDIIAVDEAGTMHIKTLCDDCIHALGLSDVGVMRHGLYSRIQ